MAENEDEHAATSAVPLSYQEATMPNNAHALLPRRWKRSSIPLDGVCLVTDAPHMRAGGQR